MLLYLAPEAPVPPLSGGRERAQRVLGALAERLPVYLLACGAGEEAAALGDLARAAGLAGLTVRPYPPARAGYVGLTPVVRRLAVELPALQAIHCQGLDLWPAARAAATDARRVLELHDLPPELQPLPTEVTPDRRHLARLTELNAASALVVVSEHDRARLKAWGVRPPIQVVENGVDLSAWAGVPEADPAAPPTLLFPAALNWPPNVAAARALVEQVLPRVRAAVPGAQAVIAGRQPSPELRAWATRQAGLTLLADPPDMRPLFAQATLVVAPFAAASGTRLKILQALAAGRAVVATPAGALGLAFADGRDLLVAPLAEAFAQACVRLLHNPAERAALVTAGRAAVARYDWDAVLPAVDAVYGDLRRT